MNEISSEFYKDQLPKFLTVDFLNDLLKRYRLLDSYEQNKIMKQYTEFEELLRINQIYIVG
jgi:hypothetical protein